MAEEDNGWGFDPELAHLSSDELADLIEERFQTTTLPLKASKKPASLSKNTVALCVLLAIAATAGYANYFFFNPPKAPEPPAPIVAGLSSLEDLKALDLKISSGAISLDQTAPDILQFTAEAICSILGCDPDKTASKIQLVDQDTFRRIVSRDRCQILDPDTLTSFAGTGQSPVINKGHVLTAAPTSQATELFRQALGEIVRNPEERRLNPNEIQKGPVIYTKNDAGCFTAEDWQIRFEQAIAETEVARLMDTLGIKTQIPLSPDVLKNYALNIRDVLFDGDTSVLLRARYQSDPEGLFYLVGRRVFEVYSNRKDVSRAETIDTGKEWLRGLFS